MFDFEQLNAIVNQFAAALGAAYHDQDEFYQRFDAAMADLVAMRNRVREYEQEWEAYADREELKMIAEERFQRQATVVDPFAA